MVKHPEYWHHPIKRRTVELDLTNDYYKDIYEFIKNLLARRRLLLWGTRFTPGGEEMEEQ